ncbi:MAG TPA: pyrroline-5-carboxylate reductase [Persephonella sp.]|uniref:Pyrroline-5-carboxylate reductase n=1 Tax=Persephonella marina (strain DSM 14350 / EX-H1) TaxID=123214 RepID=C0QUL3_PERMH|nr:MULTISPECIES: pyrroline-5-carboxylate reductase [Persephonella]ACO04049.1 pyrroline-5-carboxylate reductase [Persephonella marina EX-H1]HCB70005.1 pyrroline-5-carboxylate reductase [Persephonella sp.]
MFRIGIIGCGNMGEALIKGFIEKGGVRSTDIIVSDIDPERVKQIVNRYNVAGTESNRKVVDLSQLIILAVKPKDIENTLEPLKDLFDEGKIVVSVLAGVKIERIKNILGKDIPVVRVMPNTPAVIGEGAVGISFDPVIDQEKRKEIKDLFSSVGLAIVVEESLMDAVTGLSGSGPAYVFTFIDALAQGGVKCGLSYREALDLAVQTVLGSAMLIKETGEHPSVLRDRVTSPGGTTIYGLHELEKGSLRDTVINAVESATKRSKELSE